MKPSERANSASATPLRLQIYRQLRQAIANGTFPAGGKLPPSRDHAKSMGVARNSLLWALERLKAEGFIHTRVGDGTYVTDVAHMLPTRRRQGLHHATSTAPGVSRRGQALLDVVRDWPPPVGDPIAFRVGYPALNAFPFQTWERLTRQVQKQQGTAMARYIAPAGHPPLQEAISQWLLVSRGIRCDAAQVIVVSGSQQALDLVGRLLLDPGDEVLIEDPGYQGIRASLVGHGAVVRPVPLDADGMDIDSVTRKWPRARMAVVTPSWQCTWASADAWRCWPGHASIKPGSWKTTTTASFNTCLTEHRPCPAWMNPVAPSMSARFQSLFILACALASSWCLMGWLMRSQPRRRSQIATIPRWSKPCWPNSLRTGTCFGICSACGPCTQNGSRS